MRMIFLKETAMIKVRGSVSKWREWGNFPSGSIRFFTSPMEILPILEANTSPKPNVWYVLSPEGDGPCIRVGHTCTFVAGEPRRVLVIGGANPDGSFADVHVLDLGLLLKLHVGFYLWLADYR